MLHKKMRFFSTLTGISVASLLTLPVQAAVVASVKPVGFIAAAIADGIVPVEILLPDGVSEHDYALRPSDIKRLQDAELVVWVGPEMEAFMAKFAAGLPAQKNLEMVRLRGVKVLLLKGEGNEAEEHGGDSRRAAGGHKHHHHGEYNMHLWMSPEIAKKTAVAIHAKLLEIMPQSKDKLDANLQYFEAELSSTDAKIGNQLTPVKGKGYFVFHDAYTYFEKHYGLTPTGHFTVNPDIQPGAQRLHQIRTELVEHKVVCVFAEPQFRPAVIDTVARGTKVRSGTLDPLGTNIILGRDSYVKFLSQLSNQYTSCLKGE